MRNNNFFILCFFGFFSSFSAFAAIGIEVDLLQSQVEDVVLIGSAIVSVLVVIQAFKVIRLIF